MYTYTGLATEKGEPCFPRQSGKSEHMQLGKGWEEENSKMGGKEKKDRQPTGRQASGHEEESDSMTEPDLHSDADIQ